MRFDLSIIGLGKLGSSMMGCFASKKIKVIGYDKKIENVSILNKGKSPVQETNLNKIINENKKYICATHELSKVVNYSDITFVVVPTPTSEDGSYNLEIVKKCLKELSINLRKKKKYHLIVLCSTVLPEDSEKYLIPIIEKYSQKKFQKNFGFVYSPEFISLGNIVNEFLYPEIVLIGSQNKKDKEIISKIYEKLYSKKLFKFMKIKEAELTKISVNCLMTAKISFSNMIGLFCLNMPKANSTVVLNSVKSFFDNFKKGYKSGLGYGGPCLPRDNLAMSYLSKKYKLKINLPRSVDTTNKLIPKHLYNKFLSKYKNKKILFVGISYKPKTSYYEKSQTLSLINFVKEKNFVSVFDFNKLNINFETKIKKENKIDEAIKRNDIIVLCHLDKRYKKINFRNKKVIDFWDQI
jgi:nucleotide sugar dehydrogenase